MEISFVQRHSWCFAIILACFQYVLLCLKIHDMIPFAGNKSSALSVARTLQSNRGSSSSSGSSFGTSSTEGLLFAAWLLSCSLGSWTLGSVVSSSGSLSGIVSSTLAACAVVGHLHLFLFGCVIRCVVWSFFFISSVIVHVPEA